MTARVSGHDREKIDDIMAGYGDWFSAQLLRLIAKADHENMARLRLAFPDHVEAYETWMRGPHDAAA
jgi:pyridoxal/pyridoxine/pyridoxamine kinase